VLCGYCCLLTERNNRLGSLFKVALAPSYQLAYLAIYLCAIKPVLLYREISLGLHAQSLLISSAEVAILILLEHYLLGQRLEIRSQQKTLPFEAIKWA
jgi:hypothetical protein